MTLDVLDGLEHLNFKALTMKTPNTEYRRPMVALGYRMY